MDPTRGKRQVEIDDPGEFALKLAEEKRRQLADRLRGGALGEAKREDQETRDAFSVPRPEPPDNFVPGLADIAALFASLLDCDHLRKNRRYRAKAQLARIHMVVGHQWPIACVGLARGKDSNAPDPDQYVIQMSDGFLEECASYALRTPMAGFPIQGSLTEFIRSRALGGPAPAYPDPQGDVQTLHSWQAALLRAMVAGTLAHELGHVCLDHLFGPGYEDYRQLERLDIARNQEREADSFAASVMATSPYRAHRLRAQISAWLVRAYSTLTSRENRTHPADFERLRNLIRNNEDAARELGLDESLIDELVGLGSD